MSEFPRASLTNQGLALLAKIQAGEITPKFTRMTAGDGVLPSTTNPQELTALINETYRAQSILAVTDTGNNAVILTAEISTALVDEGFYLRELGVWAQETDGSEILYAYANAGDYVTRMPATGSGQATIFEVDVEIAVSHTEDVTINLGDGGSESTVSRWSTIEAIFEHNFNDYPLETVIQIDSGLEIEAVSIYLSPNAQQVRINKIVSGTPEVTKLSDNTWRVDYLYVSFLVALGDYLKRGQNLSDLNDKDTARNNLNAAHADHIHDERYLTRANNLSDVVSVDTARDNLKAAHVDHTHAAYLLRQLLAGAIMPFAGETAPEGALICDGRALNRTVYAALFAAIGAAWGAGNGITTFNIPDLRGLDNGRGVDSDRTLGSAQGDAIRNIEGEFGSEALMGGAGITGNYPASGAFSAVSNARGHLSATTAAGNAHIKMDISKVVPVADENRPRNVAVNYIIWSGL